MFLADLKALPLPDPLHFAEEREKAPSDFTPIALIQSQWGCGPGRGKRCAPDLR